MQGLFLSCPSAPLSLEMVGGDGSWAAQPWLTLWDQRREALRGDEFVFSFVHFVKLHVQ